jgi:hypothetical protein
MCAPLLKTCPVASLGEKVEIARTAKEPVWSQAFLAKKLAGRLGRTEATWLTRIKDIETRRTPNALELAEISEVLQTDYSWQTSEDDQPVRWRTAYDHERRRAKSETKVEEKRVPYWGHIPATGWRRPTTDVETVSTNYDKPDEPPAFTVRNDKNAPRIQPDSQVLVKPTGMPAEGVYNVACSPNGDLEIGKIRRIQGRWEMYFLNEDFSPIDVTDWDFLGHVCHIQETNDGGIR